jgi:hypothetical protein
MNDKLGRRQADRNARCCSNGTPNPTLAVTEDDESWNYWDTLSFYFGMSSSGRSSFTLISSGSIGSILGPGSLQYCTLDPQPCSFFGEKYRRRTSGTANDKRQEACNPHGLECYSISSRPRGLLPITPAERLHLRFVQECGDRSLSF